MNYETAEEYQADAYIVGGVKGIAWAVLGWETEPDEDTVWSGYEQRTGNLVAVMIGDDHKHSIEPDELTAIEREDYCGSCGQIGCRHDGLDRSGL